MSTTAERLHDVRAALEGRGVVDVKFYFERGSLQSQTGEQVASAVAHFLECYVNDCAMQRDSVGDIRA